MLKLFIKKPVWAVVFAVAAIFATTFASCAKSDDPPAPVYVSLEDVGAEEEDAVGWRSLSANVSQWSIATASGVIQPGGGYWSFQIVTKASLEATLATSGYYHLKADALDAITGVTEGAIYKVETLAGSATSGYYTASAANKLTIAGAAAGDIVYVSAEANVKRGAADTGKVETGSNSTVFKFTGVKVGTNTASTALDGYQVSDASGDVVGTEGKYYLVEAATGVKKGAASSGKVATGSNLTVFKFTGVKVGSTAASTALDGYQVSDASGDVTGIDGNYYLVETVNVLKGTSDNDIVAGAANTIYKVTGVKVGNSTLDATISGYWKSDASKKIVATQDAYYLVEAAANVIQAATDATTDNLTVTQNEKALVKLTGVKVGSETADATINGAFKEVGTGKKITVTKSKYYLVESAAAENKWKQF